MVLAGPRVRSTTKFDSKNSLYPLSHFTEHLVGVFRKLPRENDLDHESSRFLIRWLKSTTGIQPATIHNRPTKQTVEEIGATVEHQYKNSERES
jgi:hypothetical protein